MPKQTWIFASILSVLLVLGVIGASAWKQSHEFKKVLAELQDLQAQSLQQTAQTKALKEELEQSRLAVETLQREKEEVTKAQQSLENEMRSALQSRDVTISELQGKLTVNILDRILFDSAEAVLKPEGEKVLNQIATVLAQYPKRQIHVIGHTDNVPIRAGRSPFQTNWELSVGRATAAVRYLTEKAGVDPHMVAAVGYGEFHPISDNSTPEGRARNRRIALVVMPEDFARVETLQTNISPGTDLNTPSNPETKAEPPAKPLENEPSTSVPAQ
ncbi:MAG: OmpA family protein [Verrucomicrobiota bacterium]|nr:OmpA family protein [Verrucomicrobiota bacterium]